MKSHIEAPPGQVRRPWLSHDTADSAVESAESTYIMIMASLLKKAFERRSFRAANIQHHAFSIAFYRRHCACWIGQWADGEES